MGQLCITRLVSGGVITNYHCASRCDHCLYNCGPRRAKVYVDADQADRIFSDITPAGKLT